MFKKVIKSLKSKESLSEIGFVKGFFCNVDFFNLKSTYHLDFEKNSVDEYEIFSFIRNKKRNLFNYLILSGIFKKMYMFEFIKSILFLKNNNNELLIEKFFEYFLKNKNGILEKNYNNYLKNVGNYYYFERKLKDSLNKKSKEFYS
jgi:hypothetical protein